MKRHRPFQTGSSRFEVRGPKSGGMYEVWETWWYIDRNCEKDQDEEWLGAYPTEALAIAERDRRVSQ